MTFQALREYVLQSLSGNYSREEILSFFGLLLENYLAVSQVEAALNPHEEIPREAVIKIQQAVRRLQNYEPVQYILGETEFFGLNFRVNKNCLIPRPETEELVDWILSVVKRDAIVLDIGTGSGCIAVSLAKHLPEATVHALDISGEALKIAAENAVRNNVQVRFIEEDVLLSETLPLRYDLIVSNPPYVRESEKKLMAPNVLNFEPAQALFVEDTDPLLFYRKIARLARRFLNPGGRLFFEINEYFSAEILDLLTAKEFREIELKKDIFGKFRMIGCRL